jgi:hypothetical protein
MASYCVVKALHTEWLITNQLDRQQCTQQGGVIEERPDTSTGCGSTQAAAYSYQGLSESGLAGRTAALSLVPLRLFRAAFAKSPLMAKLEETNTLAAGELEAVFKGNPELAAKLRDAFLECSLLAAAMMMGDRAGLKAMTYTKDQHKRLADLAKELGACRSR